MGGREWEKIRFFFCKKTYQKESTLCLHSPIRNSWLRRAWAGSSTDPSRLEYPREWDIYASPLTLQNSFFFFSFAGVLHFSPVFYGKIAKIILNLSSSAQFHPSTIKRVNLVPKLYKWVHFHSYAGLACHGGLPRRWRVSLGLYLVVKYPFYP